MTLLVRTSLFLAMSAVTVICCLLFSSADTRHDAGVVVYLPSEIPGHSGQKSTMGEQERKWLPHDTTFLKMVYKEDNVESESIAEYRALHATLIVAGTDSRSLHRPQVCLIAQGWEIVEREIVKLNTKGGELSVMNYHLSRFRREANGAILVNENGEKIVQRAFYCYWWIGPNDSTPSDEQRVWKSTWNSIISGETERWAYPSVMAYVDERLPIKGVDEAKQRVYGFIENYAPDFQKSLGAIDREDAESLHDL